LAEKDIAFLITKRTEGQKEREIKRKKSKEEGLYVDVVTYFNEA